MRIITLVALCSVLTACAGQPAQMPVNLNLTGSDYCSIARPVRWHEKDTKDTITGVRRENAKYARVCGPAAKAKAKAKSKGWVLF
jgi:hypothetical protein